MLIAFITKVLRYKIIVTISRIWFDVGCQQSMHDIFIYEYLYIDPSTNMCMHGKFLFIKLGDTHCITCISISDKNKIK